MAEAGFEPNSVSRSQFFPSIQLPSATSGSEGAFCSPKLLHGVKLSIWGWSLVPAVRGRQVVERRGTPAG